MPVLAAIGEGLVELGLDEGADRASLSPGGDAANIAVMASRLGAAVRLGGCVGSDRFGEWLLSFWREAGVDVSHVRRDPMAATGLYLNEPDAHGGHAFTYWRKGSAGSRLLPDDIDDAFFADVGTLVVTGVTLAVSASSAAAAQSAIRRARSVGAAIACVLNHRPSLGGDANVLASVARAADVVIGSVEDTILLFGEQDPARLADGPLEGTELVLTAGPSGATAVVDGTVIEQRVAPARVVNSAGAGDALAGAYLALRLTGRSPSSALAWGVAAAASSVTRPGCARSYPTAAEAANLADELVTSS